MKKFEIIFLLFSVLFSGFTLLFLNEISKGVYGCIFPGIFSFLSLISIFYAHLHEREENER